MELSIFKFFLYFYFIKAIKYFLQFLIFRTKANFSFPFYFWSVILRYFTVYSLVLILNILNWLILKSFCSTVAHLEQITQDCLSHEYLYPKVSIRQH